MGTNCDASHLTPRSIGVDWRHFQTVRGYQVMAKKLGHRGERILRFIQQNPGCTAADADRATNDYINRGNHAHHVTYDSVNRLVRNGFVTATRKGGRKLLTAVVSP